MKHLLFYPISVLMFATIVTSCDSNNKTKDNSNMSLEHNSAQMNDAQHMNDEQRKMNEEYEAFKVTAMKEIKENDEKIDELNTKINQSGNTSDDGKRRRIENLKEENTKLRARLNNYSLNTSDWQSFKTNFNKDLKNVGDSFNDLFSAN